MALMGWSSPKTAMEYVNKSKHSCIKMSMYLTNVQRQNRPLLLTKNDFLGSTKNGQKLSSACLSNLQSVSKEHSIAALPVESQVESSSFAHSVALSESDLEITSCLADSAALFREVEEEEEVLAASQALIADLLDEDTKFSVAVNPSALSSEAVVAQPVVECSASSDIRSNIGESLARVFPNMSNFGTMNLNIYFGK